MERGMRLPTLLREIVQLEELGPDAATDRALGEATGLEIEEVRSLMADAVAEELATWNPHRSAWVLTSTGLESIETV
jgi:hypothetical protein